MLHSAGWLEGGLTSSYEKFVMDIDQLAMMEVLCKGIDLSENGQAMDAIREVGPGAHFLGCAHTQANFESAFYRSTIADNNSFEQWQVEGEMRAVERASKITKEMLASYQMPDMDMAKDEELLAYIAKRKEQFPDSNI